ncbi:urea ABC transporter substrate-binding protein [Thiospirillum jenense]|uniref:Urea ABC transporter substrate-binding protein n=1 Tax=Thiospirillum jenense TaxID=1653858 RepID=A0A839HGC6_9GAMM|nr:urea ABC transporter substrate-binding protein [Thiospirillum jenense]MBB1127060.1 urea ABC transporter substrate-binding protein [Thiospirillum jenense]
MIHRTLSADETMTGTSRRSRRSSRYRRRVLSTAVLLALGLAWVTTQLAPAQPARVVRVGILHSLTGTMSLSEAALAKATIAALEDVNQQGGVMGYRLEPVLADGGSSPAQFAAQAESLIREHRVQVIFGCWTSAARKAVKPVVENHHNLLMYPVQFEGLELSDSIVYLGQTPNQQIKPAVKYAVDNLGKQFYLIGSDYIFPRTANWYLTDIAHLVGAEIVGERYVPLGQRDFNEIIHDIRTKKPQVIFNTLNGDSNLYFFDALAKAFSKNADGIPPMRVMSFSIGEYEIEQIAAFAGADAIIGHYASWNYFASIDSDTNRHFTALLNKAGIKTPNDPMSAAYTGVWLYKQAVEECESFEPERLKPCFAYQSFNGPAGIVTLEKNNFNTWQHARIGQVTTDLSFQIVWASDHPIQPQNFPPLCQPKTRLRNRLTAPAQPHDAAAPPDYEIGCAP